MDIGNNFQFWRFHHLKTVERIIGHKRGTAARPGVSFLKKAIDIEFFPELIQVRTEIGGPAGGTREHRAMAQLCCRALIDVFLRVDAVEQVAFELQRQRRHFVVDLAAFLGQIQDRAAAVGVGELPVEPAVLDQLGDGARLTATLSSMVRSATSTADRPGKRPRIAMTRHSGIDRPNFLS